MFTNSDKMSRERCRSLDRAHREQQQRKNSLCSGGYIPARSPNRSPIHVPSTPELVRQNYDGDITQHTLTECDFEDQEHFNRSCAIQYENDFEEIASRRSDELHDEFYTVNPLQIEDFPDEFLEEFEEPSFYEIPENASFDEVMCAMATPPAAEKPKVAIDDVRKRIAAHIGKTRSDEGTAELVIDDVRKRMAAMIAATESEPQECPYKMPPLPEDPRDIPPHPKDPKDVVAIIRRAKAIARLKAIEEAEAAAKGPKGASKKPEPRKLVASTRKGRPPAPNENQVRPTSSQHPPDYVAPEWAAAILRTRNLAGLKTKNPILLPKTKTPPCIPTPKISLPSSPPISPSYENILERAAAIKRRKDAAKAAAIAQQTPVRTYLTPKAAAPVVDEDLDEFEAMEQLYNRSPRQYSTTVALGTDMQDRMAALQRQLFQSPTVSEPKATSPSQSPLFELPPVLRYHDLLKRQETLTAAEAQATLAPKSPICQIPEYEEDLAQLQGIADWGLLDLSGPHPKEIQHMPEAPKDDAPSYQSRFEDEFLQNIEVPDFDVEEIPDFAFSPEAMTDAGFVVDQNVSLGEISMPDFDEDISIDEYGLEDITSPDLCNLSMSVSGMALEPDYPSEMREKESVEKTEQFAESAASETPGYFTSMVNTVVDSFKNIFTPTTPKLSKENEENDDENLLNTSLPNMFEVTPPPPAKLESKVSENAKPAITEGPIIIPPHPKDPKDIIAIVKRAQAIQKKKAKEAAEAAPASETPLALSSTVNKGKREITSTIPKRATLPKKKAKSKDERPAKIYPDGEYSPGHAAAVAHARSLAGLKNKSAVLNPERAARIAEKKAAKEAELAAIEALPTVERMRTKMERLKARKPGEPCARPSVEALGALEAIRASLPKPEIQTIKRKWKPRGRFKTDRRIKPEERVFTQDFGRVLIPTLRTAKTKKGWRKLEVLSPLTEEDSIQQEDFIQFSPLKPHEAQMRLQYLKEQRTRRAVEEDRAEFYSRSRSPKTPATTPSKYSPIRLYSPGSPRTEHTRKERVTTQIGENGGEETITEETVETSTIENGEVYTSTRHVSTKTDEYGNVIYHITEGKGRTGEEDAVQEDLANVEPPDYFNTSDLPAPRDPSIPTPSEIIDSIRLKVQQKLKMALQTNSALTQLPQSPGIIDFPEDLPDELLFDIETPEFEKTHPRESPRTRILTPIEKDERMYAWGEQPSVTPRPTTPKAQGPLPTEVEVCPTPKSMSPEGTIVIPPHPKDPKNYKAMIKRAQAIQKRLRQQEAEAAANLQPPVGKLRNKGRRDPITQWIAPLLKDIKKPPRKRLILKKRIPKAAPKNYYEDYEGREVPAEAPPLPENYAEHVARARLIHGLTNETAALNPKIAKQLAVKKAEEEAAKAAYEALSEHEKIKMRMEQLRRIPSEKRNVKASVDMLGTIAAIKATMPPIEEILRLLSPKTPYTPTQLPTQTGDQLSLRAPLRGRGHRSPGRTDTDALREAIENDKVIWEDEQQQACLQENIYEGSKQLDITPLQALVTPIISRTPSPQRDSPHRAQASSREPTNFSDLSLAEFEHLEAMANLPLNQLEAVHMETNKSCPAYTSLDEFEALEAEAKAQGEGEFINSETPKRKERYSGRRLFTPPPPPNKSQRLHTTPSPISCPQRPPPRLSFAGYGYNYDNLLLEKDDASQGGIYHDEIQDFNIPKEQIVLETSNLMPETPINIQERFRRLKEAQQRQINPQRVADEVVPVSPVGSYNPISLMSPSDKSCKVPIPQVEKSLISSIEGELLVDFDKETTQRCIRRFDDLEDIPFDDLEFEDEPSFKNVSLDKPMTPLPLPSDIISRVRSMVKEKLREDARRSPLRSPGRIPFPEDLPDEELFELSAPAFEQTPQRTPSAREKSPRVSLPMAWGETQPLTPTTPPVRVSSPTRKQDPLPEPEVVEVTKVPSSEGPIVVPPHPKDPRDIKAIIKRAQAIQKLKQQEAEASLAASLIEPPKAKSRVSISRWQGPPPKRHNTKLRKKLVRKSDRSLTKEDEEERVCPVEPPPLPENYAEHVARARLIHGLKNRTAALNPKIAVRIAAKRVAEEAAAAAYAALPAHEKLKVRMERLRRMPERRRGAKPTIEQIAYLEALKLTEAYDHTTSPQAKTPPRTSVVHEVPLTPQHYLTDRVHTESLDLAEFKALEQIEGSLITRPPSQKDNAKHKVLESVESLPMLDVSLAEYEALEAVVAPPGECPSRPVSPLNISQIIADLQEQQLATPPRIDPRERYKQVLAQMQATPKSPEHTTEIQQTPDVYYSPLRLSTSPSKGEETTRAEKSTTQITRSGNNTIKEQVTETSEIVNGELQQITKHVTTTTDPNGNITCQIHESKRISARDTMADWEHIEDLGDIEEPSFLDTTPVTPLERPRPRDIIDRVAREVKEGVGKYRPEVPTGTIIDLRTPPRMLPLPKEVSDENLFELSGPAFVKTPPRTPVRSPVHTPKRRSPERTPNISIPEMFVSTPQPTPMPSTTSSVYVSPLRQRAPSPEGPIVIPPHPKDPTDFAAMIKRARKIQQLRAQEESERLLEEEAAATAQTEKSKKRVPLSRWIAPPAQKPRTRKKLVIRKRGEPILVKTSRKTHEPRECPAQPPPLPEDYAEHIARARKLAGLKNRTAALNPKVAAREAAKAEAARITQEAEAARLEALNAPPPPPIKDFADLLSRMTSIRKKGAKPKGQPSIAAAAYLNALKGAMQVRQQQSVDCPIESPKSRYRRLKAKRATASQPTYEVSPLRMPRREDIPYTPLRFVSPRSQDDNTDLAEEVKDVELNIGDFQGLEELAELEEPSYMDVSQWSQDDNQYMPLTPPETPTKIIRRISQQVRQQQPPACPIKIPQALEFPEDLPEEELFELSAPSFATSPARYETPIRSPNISIPQYFEQTPPPTPKADTSRSGSPQRSRFDEAADIGDTSPQPIGVCPGVRVKTPEGRIVIPPHPRDPTNFAAMIRRAQLIQKLREREAAEVAVMKTSREPLSRRVTKPFIHSKKGRLFRKLVLKKKAPAAVPPTLRECPLEPPVLPTDYLEAVAKARKLAGLKNTTALLKPKVMNREEPTPPPPDFATIMKRAAAFRAAKTSGMDQELTAKQNLRKRKHRQSRKRLLRELEMIRQQQAAENIPLDFGLVNTPPEARQRFEILKSRMQTETPLANQIPYSPVKTPDLTDLPYYQPLAMPKTPPYEFLENFNITDIEDMSMPYDELDDYEIIEEPVRRDFSSDQHEFDIAEAEAAAIEQLQQNDMMEMLQNQSGQHATELDSFEIAEAEAAAHDYNMCRRIEMLQNQLFETPSRQKLISRSVAENAAAIEQEELDIANAEASGQDFDLAKRIQQLENQYLQSPRPRNSSPRGNKITSKAEEDMTQYEQFLENETLYPMTTSQQQEIDEFEAMERQCR